MTDKVMIVGAGAIGGFYGALLAKAGAEVSVVCRSDYAVVAERGFHIQSSDLGQWHFQPHRVLQTAEDYPDAADFVILCSKVTPQIDRVSLIQGAVKDDTSVVFIQNGVDIEAELQQAFPDNELISGLAFVCCNRVEKADIRHLAYGRLTLGNLPGGVSAKTQRLQSLFLKAGIDCEISEDIVTSRWQKCVWNAAFNPLSVLSGGLPTLSILQNQEGLVRRIMQEVCTIAGGCGHRLPQDIIESNIRKTWVMPPYKTSMLLDFERGQVMETEAILGNVVRCGKRHGIASPTLETLYELLELRSSGVGHQVQEKS